MDNDASEPTAGVVGHYPSQSEGPLGTTSVSRSYRRQPTAYYPPYGTSRYNRQENQSFWTRKTYLPNWALVTIGIIGALLLITTLVLSSMVSAANQPPSFAALYGGGGSMYPQHPPVIITQTVGGDGKPALPVSPAHV